MNITKLAIEKNRVTIIALLIVVLLGFSSYNKMPRAEDPGFVIRVALVTTFFPGATPERVESLISDKLEKAIREMPELDYVASTSKTGVSIVVVNIKESYAEMRPIWDDLRRKIDNAKEELPSGVIGPYVNDEYGDVFGTILTLTGEGYNYAELKEVADDVRDELLLLKEVAKVDIYGAQEERIFVEYSNARLAELGMSPGYLQQILESRNIINPGGEIIAENRTLVLEPTGNFESLEQLRRTVVQVPGKGDLLYLEDIAKIFRGYVDPPESKMFNTAVPCLGLAVSMREGGNLINLGNQVKALKHDVESRYPHGIDFDFVSFQPDIVDDKVNEFISNLLQAIAVVILVMVMTLGLRTGLLVATLIPMTMLASFILMSVFDIGLNQVSLAALIIALGMLVDNAIVMSESIMTQISDGKKPMDAAIDSAQELAIPLLTSSLTTAAAFLPIYLAESMVGEYCAPLFKVVTIALLCSWILALTMIPMLCYRYIKVKAKDGQDAYGSRFYNAYRSFLIKMLRFRSATLAIVVTVFVVAMGFFAFLPKMFFPSSDRAMFTTEFILPVGTPIDQTEELVAEVEEYLQQFVVNPETDEEGIVNWATYVGDGGPRFYLASTPETSAPEYALMLINTTSDDIIEDLMKKIDAYCSERYYDLNTKIRKMATGGPVDDPIQIRLTGKDTKTLFEIVDTVTEKLAGTLGTRDVRNDWGQRTPKLLVNVSEERARRAGVTNQDIAYSLQTILSGFSTTEFREEDKVIPIHLRSVAADRKDLGKLDTLNVYAQSSGQSVPLKQVADIEIHWQNSKIQRRDSVRTVAIKSELQPGALAADVVAQIEPWLTEQKATWPSGYNYELGGEAESADESNQAIMDKLPIAGFIIILLLVTQFNSLRRPTIIMLTIPLGLIGVVFGLTVARSYFGFMTLLGIVSLSGIVINNAIVLLDRIKIEIEERGLSPQQAIVEAGQRRFRPILLTTATTVCGLLPLWFGGGPMWEPMAIAIIFGLLFSTVLTLGVVPVLYSLLFRVNFKGFEYKSVE